MIKSPGPAILALLGIFLAAGIASAVPNAGFESPALSNGTSANGLPPNWTGRYDAMAVKDPASGAVLQASEGENYLWIGSGWNECYQNLGIIQADTTYRLKIDVGVNGSYQWYWVGFKWASGSYIGDWIAGLNQTNVIPVTNGWLTLPIEFSTTDMPDLVGKNLIIFLTGADIALDNVVYSETPAWDGSFNGSFEYDPLADDESLSSTPPAGWVSSMDYELRNPTAAEPLQPSHGSNLLRLNNAAVTHLIPDGVKPGCTYAVDVDVSRTSGLPFSWYQVRFAIYHNGSWTIPAEVNHNISYPPYNNWNTVHIEFSTDTSHHPGARLELQLNGSGIVYDNTRLSITNSRTVPRTYYVSSSSGQDFYPGTSTALPYRTFANLNAQTLLPGDKVLLKRGDTWNEELHLCGEGTPGNPIELSSYGTGPYPRIQRTDKYTHHCVVLESPAHWRINELDCRQAKVGIYLRYFCSPNNQDVEISDCYFQDIDQLEVWDPAAYDYELSFNTSIMVGGKIYDPYSFLPIIDGLTVRDCAMRSVGNGVLCNWYYPPPYRNRVRNLLIEDCWASGGFGMLALFHVNGATIRRCHSVDGQDQFMHLGTTQGIVQASKNVTIENCVFEAASRQGGAADGCGFDFEGDTVDCVFRNNVSFNNDGPSLLILSSGGPNLNLAVEDCTFFNNCRDAITQFPGHNYEIGSWNNTSTGALSNVNVYRANSDALYADPAYFAGFTQTNVRDLSYSTVAGRPTVWNFNTDGDFQGWAGANHLANLAVTNGELTGDSTGIDPYIHSAPTWVVAGLNPIWHICTASTGSIYAQIYFITDTDPVWDGAKTVAVPLIPDGSYHDYHVDMTQCPAYQGVITQMRLDPAVNAGAAFALDQIALGNPGRALYRTSHYPHSFNVTYGSWVSGDTSTLQQKEVPLLRANDYIKINATYSAGSYLARTDLHFTALETNAERLKLVVTDYEAAAGSGKVVYLHLYNYQTAQFEQIGSFTAATEITDRIIVLHQPARFIGPGGAATLRVELLSNSTNILYLQYAKLRTAVRVNDAGDVNRDEFVDLADHADLQQQWQKTGCNAIDGYCYGADINDDGTVNFHDLLMLTDNWLNQ